MKSVTISTTMGPGIKIDIASVESHLLIKFYVGVDESRFQGSV